MFSKSKPCLTGLFIEESLRVKKVLSFQLHWGFAVFFLQRDFPGPVIWTLWPAEVFFPHYEQIYEAWPFVCWGAETMAFCECPLLRTVVTEIRNVIHLLSLLHSLAASGRCSRPAWLGYVLQNGPMFCWQHSRQVCSWIFWELTVWLKLKWTGLSDKSLCW